VQAADTQAPTTAYWAHPPGTDTPTTTASTNDAQPAVVEETPAPRAKAVVKAKRRVAVAAKKRVAPKAASAAKNVSAKTPKEAPAKEAPAPKAPPKAPTGPSRQASDNENPL
jgi:hypothetical protein